MDKNFYVPKKEWMTYCIGALGQGMIYAIMSSYISDFYLNVLKVTPIFVLLLMLLARIWDAINDPIMGYIMDRANPKKGKMKPYILYTPIPVAILTLLLFYAPNLSDSKKMIYAPVTIKAIIRKKSTIFLIGVSVGIPCWIWKKDGRKMSLR